MKRRVETNLSSLPFGSKGGQMSKTMACNQARRMEIVS